MRERGGKFLQKLNRTMAGFVCEQIQSVHFKLCVYLPSLCICRKGKTLFSVYVHISRS